MLPAGYVKARIKETTPDIPVSNAPAPRPQIARPPSVHVDIPINIQSLQSREIRAFYGVDRMRRSIYSSRNDLNKYLLVRAESIRQIGGNLASNVADPSVMYQPYPVNKLAFYFNTLKRFLVPGNLRCLVTAKAPEVEPSAKALQQVLNQAIVKTGMKDVVSSVVGEALVGTGFVKIGWGEDGLPCARSISMDDIFFDTAAKKWSEITFIGDKYMANVDSLAAFAQDNPESFNVEAVLKLQQDFPEDGCANDNGSNSAAWAQQANEIYFGNFEESQRQRMERVVKLYDFYIPHKKVTLTICDDCNEVLRVVHHGDGVGCPYKRLILEDLPDSLLGNNIGARLQDMNKHVQNVWMQNAEAAANAKSIWMYRKGAATQDEVELLASSRAGYAIPVSNPQDFNVITMAGVDSNNQGYAIQVDDQINKLSGGIDALAGVGTNAPTATQDELISASASKAVGFMQQSVYNFCADILKDMNWMVWHEGEMQYGYTEQMDVFGEKTDVSMVFAPGHREYDYDTINVEIAPYSEVIRTPEQRMNDLMAVFNGVLLPIAPMLMAQGYQINFPAFVAKVAEYSGLYELNGIVQQIPPEQLMMMEQQQQEQPQEQGGAPKPAKTERTYTRRSEVRTDPGAMMEKQKQASGGDKGVANKAGNKKAGA